MLNIIPSKISIVNFKIFSRLFHLLVWMVWGLSIQTMHANPIDGVVSAGQATINSQPNYMEITQQSEHAVIDWVKFDMAANEHTNFKQPSSNAVTLNRIHSDEASNINGRLTANGKLILINQNGIMFGRDSKVDVNGLLATTSNISNQRFMEETQTKQRQLLFKQAGKGDAAIVNEGEINAAKGLVGLVAPKVLNSGIIQAKVGKVVLATGDKFTLDLYGDRLLNIAISDEKQQQLLMNSGQIIADGGEVLLTSSSGKNIVDSLIINTGLLAARHVEERDGKIIIFAEGSNAVKGNIAKHKCKKQGSSKVLVRGMVDVSGINPGEKGGLVQISGDEVVVSQALIDASGYEGQAGTTVGLEKSAKRVGSAGGEILIGGDYLGKGKVPTAERLLVDRDVMILNDAIEKGDAGRNIFWSDGITSFHGKVFARALGGKGLGDDYHHGCAEEERDNPTFGVNPKDGLREYASANPILGGNFGDGGFVETSGKKKLDAGGYVNLLASNGITGAYLLDPSTVNIYGNFDPKFVSTDGSINLSNDLAMWLDFSDQTKVQLSYQNVLNGSSDSPVSITVAAVSGSNTLNVNNASADTLLKVGARIKLGSTGLEYANVTETPNDQATNNTGIYTITNISGSTLTITPQLKQNYAVNTILYQGYVSTVYDKSGGNNNGNTIYPSHRPLWLSGLKNNLGAISQFRGVEVLTIRNPSASIAMDYIKTQTNFTYSLGFYLNGSQSGALNIFGLANTSSTNWDFFMLRPYNDPPMCFVRSNNIVYLGSKAPLITNNSHIGSLFYNYTDGKFGLYVNGGLSTTSLQNYPNTIKDINPNIHFLGARNANSKNGSLADPWESFIGDIYEAIEYKAALINSVRNLLEQYQSNKWNIPLISNPTTSYAVGIDAVSSLTTDYLVKLSATADINILSDNVNIDLKNSTLNITNDKNLNIIARNSLLVLSNGTINTTRSTTGGNISLQLNSGNMDLSNLTFNANNGGSISINSIAGSIILGKLKAGSILVNAQGSNSDLSIANSKNLETTNSNNISPLILVAGRNFYNNNTPGATVLTTAGNTYWRIYSTIPANNLGTSYEYLGASLTKSNSTYNSSSVPTDASNLLLYSHYFLDINPNVNKVEIFYGDPISSIISKIGGYTYTGYIAPDTASNDTITGQPSITTTYVPGSSIGNYNITIGQGTLQSSLGYIFNPQTITGFVKVNPISLGATLKDNITKVYDGTSNLNLAGNYDLTGLITYNGVTDQVVLVAGEGGYNNKTIGEGKTINLSNLNISGTKSSNYTLAVNTLTSTTGIITKALLTPNLKSNISKVYDGTNTAFLVNAVDLSNNYNLNGLVHGDVVSLTAASGFYDDKNVNTNKTITFSGLTISGTDSGNYLLDNNTNDSVSSGSGIITAKDLHIAADPINKIAGETDPTLTYSVTTEDLVAGETFEIIQGGLTRAAGEDVGVYPITVSTTNPLAAPNYNIVYSGADFTIEAQPITVTPITLKATDVTKIYGDLDDPSAFGYQIVEGTLLENDTLTVNFTRIQGEDVLGSPYPININSLTHPHYTFNYVPGNFNILPRPVTLAADSSSKIYGNSDPSFTYKITGGNLLDCHSLNVGLTRVAGENVADSPYTINFVQN